MNLRMEGVFVVSFQNKFGIINMQTDILQFCNVISRKKRQATKCKAAREIFGILIIIKLMVGVSIDHDASFLMRP